MRVSVKNKSPALQGVATLAGTKWIKPGASLTIEVEDTRQLERLPFLELAYSDAGVPVGDLPPPPKSLLDKARSDLHAAAIQGSAAETVAAADHLRALQESPGERPAVSMALKKDELIAIAKAEGVEFESDDNKADLIRKIEAGRK